jgi:uncharacterized phage protein (TIGR01671 family)
MSKYKAWDTVKKKMWSAKEMGRDQLTLSPDGRGFINVSGVRTSDSHYLPYLIPLEFTGLPDKNSKEIYEGDKIGTYDPIKLERGEEADYAGIVSWSEKILAWILVDNEGKFINMLCRAEQPEVIGNIHENPELPK